MTEDPDKYHEEVAPVVFELRDPKHLLWRHDPRRLHLYPELPGAPSHVRVAAACDASTLRARLADGPDPGGG